MRIQESFSSNSLHTKMLIGYSQVSSWLQKCLRLGIFIQRAQMYDHSGTCSQYENQQVHSQYYGLSTIGHSIAHTVEHAKAALCNEWN